jgi:hypothetical protein
MEAFDRFWQWADKPIDSPSIIPAELHRVGDGACSAGQVRPRKVNAAAAGLELPLD